MNRAASVIALGALGAFVVYALRAKNQPPQFTAVEFQSIMDAMTGEIMLPPAFKPVENTGGEFMQATGLGRSGLGEFDWGAWGTELEPWGIQQISSGIDTMLLDSIGMDTNALISAVADHLMDVEGYLGYIYDDSNGKPWSESKRGKATIGYGHLVTPADFSVHGEGWTLDNVEALALLFDDVERHLAPIIPYVKVPLTLPQWIAVTSLSFNAGPTAVKNSRFLKSVNAGRVDQAESEFKDWNKATILVDGHPVKRVVKGLVNRRNREWAMFVTPNQSVIALSDSGSVA